MRIILVGLLASLSVVAQAAWEFQGSGRQVQVSSTEIPSGYTSTATTGFGVGLFYNHFLSPHFGVRVGVEDLSNPLNFTKSGGAYTLTTNVTSVPLLLDLYLGQSFRIFAGGYYWTLNSYQLGSTSGVFAGATSVSGLTGAGFTGRAGVDVLLGHWTIGASYEPNYDFVAASSTSILEEANSINGTIGYRF